MENTDRRQELLQIISEKLDEAYEDTLEDVIKLLDIRKREDEEDIKAIEEARQDIAINGTISWEDVEKELALTNKVVQQIPVDAIFAALKAISSRDWEGFKEAEREFVTTYSVTLWERIFNERVKPALDKDSDKWLLVQWCSKGIISVKNINPTPE